MSGESAQSPSKESWDAAVTDLTTMLSLLDNSIKKVGGDPMLAAAALAMEMDERMSKAWLAHRLAVSLHMMNAATGPLSDKLARDMAAELAKLL